MTDIVERLSGLEVWRMFDKRLDAILLTLPVRDRFRMRSKIMRHAPQEAEERYGPEVAAEFVRAAQDCGWYC